MAATPADQAPTAGLLQRYAAWSLDAALLSIPSLLLTTPAIATSAPLWQDFADAMSALLGNSLRGMLAGDSPLAAAHALLADPALAATAHALQQALWATLSAPLAVFLLLALCWHVGFEHSAWRGSPGKRALGLSVTAADGSRPALARTLWRFVAGGASWLTLNLGHAMAALPPNHLALHDHLSGTRVTAPGTRRLPPWAKVWLCLQLAASGVALGWLMRWMDGVLQAALAAVLA